VDHSELELEHLGTATVYGQDGRGLILGRGKIFLYSTASRPIPSPFSLLYKDSGRFSPTGKTAGA
jgi:hypothetical protein